jgi:hypothetical protein
MRVNLIKLDFWFLGVYITLWLRYHHHCFVAHWIIPLRCPVENRIGNLPSKRRSANRLTTPHPLTGGVEFRKSHNIKELKIPPEVGYHLCRTSSLSTLLFTSDLYTGIPWKTLQDRLCSAGKRFKGKWSMSYCQISFKNLLFLKTNKLIYNWNFYRQQSSIGKMWQKLSLNFVY